MSLHNTSTRVTAVTGRASNGSASRGFSLIELMVAMALGLVLSIGVVSLFGSTSMSNKVQNSLARLQENGRYAVARMESDLRMQIGHPRRAPGLPARHRGVAPDNVRTDAGRGYIGRPFGLRSPGRQGPGQRGGQRGRGQQPEQPSAPRP